MHAVVALRWLLAERARPGLLSGAFVVIVLGMIRSSLLLIVQGAQDSAPVLVAAASRFQTRAAGVIVVLVS